jgi:hypothetical protein
MSVPPKERKPWPMKWVVVAIFVVIVPYTFLTLRYRKPGRAYEPAEDLKNRTNTARLLSAGYQRIAVTASLPVNSSAAPSAAAIKAVGGGLPSALRATLVEPPALPAEIGHVSAPANAVANAAYTLQFSCTLADNKAQISGAAVYVRQGEVVIAPESEKLSGGLLSRTRDHLTALTVPAGALKPGHYQVTIVGAQSSRAWTLDVK